MSENPTEPILDPQIKAAADAVKANRVQTRLVYAEDLTPGMVVVVPRPCTIADGIVDLLSGERVQHNHGVEERTLLEIRTAGDIVSCIALDEDGEQQSMITHRLSSVRVAVNR